MKNILSMAGMLILFACGHTKEELVVSHNTDQLDVFQVRTAPVTNSVATPVIKATGILSSNLESKPSFKTGGVIQQTYYKEGDRIQKGALLATLNMSEINAQVQQAKNAVTKATRDLQRVKNLYADSVATLELLQNVQTAYDMAIETQKIAEFNQSYSKVIAPESGIVVKQLMRTGEIVGPGMPIYAIMGTGSSDWIIKVALTDKDWARVKKGDRAEVRFEAYPNEVFQASVYKVADIGNMGSATLDVELKLNTPHHKLAAGLIANTVISPTANGTTTKNIPIEALVSSNESEAIVFIPQQGIAVKKHVRIDKILGHEVSILSGLDSVTEVITAGAVYLQEGNKIQIIK